MVLLLEGSQLAWNMATNLVFFVWLSSAFWAVLPLLGWGHYDYEPLWTCCTLDYSRGGSNFTIFLFTMAFFNFLVPLFITLTSYHLMEQKLVRSGHLQVNTTLPARTLLFGWGPYALLCLYAAVSDVSSISPKLQMVPALVDKTVSVINVINYALHRDGLRRDLAVPLATEKRGGQSPVSLPERLLKPWQPCHSGLSPLTGCPSILPYSL